MKLQDVYEWIAYKPDGSIQYGGKLNTTDLKKFELVPRAPYLKKISIDLSGRELIYFMRIYYSIGIMGVKRITKLEVDHVDFHVGYIENGKEFKMIIDAKNGKTEGDVEIGTDSISST